MQRASVVGKDVTVVVQLPVTVLEHFDYTETFVHVASHEVMTSRLEAQLGILRLQFEQSFL
ncbi:hypothetical protein D3C76_1839850 [compost metagenome]